MCQLQCLANSKGTTQKPSQCKQSRFRQNEGGISCFLLELLGSLGKDSGGIWAALCRRMWNFADILKAFVPLVHRAPDAPLNQPAPPRH